MALRKRTRRILTALLVLIVLAGVGWLALPLILEPIIRSKLGAAAEAHLGARLLMGKIDYDFPYGVRAHNVRLKHLQDDSEVFSAPVIEFSLVALPIRSGPLHIERIVFENPTVRLIRRSVTPAPPPSPSNAQTPASPPPPTSAQTPALPPSPVTAQAQAPMKLSDLFRLRVLSIRNGSVRYEKDRGDSAVVWENINSDLRLTPVSASQYGWGFTADSGAAADVAAAGTIDIDQLVLDVKQLAINARATPDGSQALPTQVQQALRRWDAQGVARFEASGNVPLRNLAAAQFSSTIHLDDAQATISGQPVKSSVTILAGRKPDARRIDLSTPAFKARVGEGTLSVKTAAGQIDPLTGKLRLNELSAALDDVTVSVRAFAEPFEHLNGTIQVTDGQLVAQDLTGTVGQDLLRLASARGQLTDSGGIELRDIDLAVRFARPHARYSGHINRALSPVDPAGDFTIRGRYSWDPLRRSEFELLIATRGGDLRVGKKQVPVTNVRGEALATKRQVVIRRALGNVFDGAIAYSGNVNFSASPIEYQGDLSLQHIDVTTFARTYFASESMQRLAGRCDATISFKGQRGVAEAFTASGDVQITEGNLWEMPVLDRVVSRIKLARDALTASEAAAVFDVADSKVQIRQSALNSPALGLHGTGVVGFDGQLDLEVTAAPLGDWERHIKKTGIPLVSDLGGNFAGGMQRLVSVATNQLLFQFKVTGPSSDPRVEPVPSPIITEYGAQILARMIRRDVNLLDALREKK